MDLTSEDVGSYCVAEIMGTELYTLTPDTVVASAKRLARENGIEHLLVLDNGTLTGIVCGEDLRSASRDALVGECMSSPVLCIGPDTTLQDAVEIWPRTTSAAYRSSPARSWSAWSRWRR